MARSSRRRRPQEPSVPRFIPRTFNADPLHELVRLGREWGGAPQAGPQPEPVPRMDVRLTALQGSEDVCKAVDVHGLSPLEGAFALVGLARVTKFSQPVPRDLARMVTAARQRDAQAATALDRACARLLAGAGGDLFRQELEGCARRPPAPAEPRAEPAPEPKPFDERVARRERARERLKDVLPWMGAALRPMLPAPVDAPPLDGDDLRLALCWAGQPEWRERPPSARAAAQRYRDNYELGRMLSARAGEKAAEAFYAARGLTVRNVSLDQLDGRADAWKTHDLTVDGRPVDVKNSRRSFSSPDTFVEHCVPRFKATRASGDVTLCAVLSPWRSVTSLLLADEASGPWGDGPVEREAVTFVGELTRGRMEALRACFPPREHLRIDFSRPGDDREFFPPWAFDAPAFVTAARDQALARIPADAFADPAPWAELHLNALPLAVATGRPWGGGFEHAWQLEFYAELRRVLGWAAEKAGVPWGLSLPFVFLGVLNHFARVLAGDAAEEGYAPSEYAPFLFADDAGRTPLGIPDPLGTVKSLLGTLDLLWRSSRDEARRFRGFRLTGMRVLKGWELTAQGEREQTLVAYCGGWTTSDAGNRVRCCRSPLVLEPPGENACRPCSRCGHLVCPTCGFCTYECPGIQERVEAGEHSVAPSPAAIRRTRSAT
jgi:hypothetical protein